MKDVAREAGVALGTVSKVFNNGSVGEDYRKRVLAAAEKLGPTEAFPMLFGTFFHARVTHHFVAFPLVSVTSRDGVAACRGWTAVILIAKCAVG